MREPEPPLIELRSMKSPGHTAYVERYALGQYRIRVCRRDHGLTYRGHGGIVRELCTYSPSTLGTVLAGLQDADDPEAYAESLARPWNCEYRGGRIRLDNVEGDRHES